MPENKIATDNTFPLVIKLSDFSFKFDKIRVELGFTSSITVH